MKLEFKLYEQDFLDFQMFTASQSARINRKKRNGWILLTAGSFLLALFFYFEHNFILSAYLGFVGIVCGLFFPRYFIWRYKRHYRAYIKENFSNRFGETGNLEIRESTIYFKDKTGEGNINLSEVEKIDETVAHFFVKVSTGQSLIIPKKECEYPAELQEKFKSLGFEINDFTGWKWN